MEVERVENTSLLANEGRIDKLLVWKACSGSAKSKRAKPCPGKTLYQIIAVLKRYLAKKGRTDINLLSKTDIREAGFCAILNMYFNYLSVKHGSTNFVLLKVLQWVYTTCNIPTKIIFA